MPTQVKFCGVTRLEDAELCAEAGAWAIGLIFVPGSARRCAPEEAARIGAALRRRVHVAGVFANAPLDAVVRHADRAGLSLVQLHGEEGPTYCDAVARRTGARVIKAVRVRTRAEVQALAAYRAVDFHLLDGAGGAPFDWELARGRSSDVPLVLAGGLTPENVGEAIATVRPHAVDVARGTESEPGVKDAARVEAFAAAVRAASPAPEAAA